MNRKFLLLLAVVALGVGLLTAGCGGDNKSAETTETTATSTTETTTTTEATTTETEGTETTETTETTATTATTPANFATAQNCQEFATFGQKISSAFSGSNDQDLQKVADQLDQLAAGAPSDVKSDFQTIADGYKAIADALKGVDLTSTNPDPQALQKLQSLGTEWSTKMTTAAQNIANWAQKNCT
jgi:hypothetical protein